MVDRENPGNDRPLEENWTPEHARLRGGDSAWRQWGPYLSERAWGTVREDYSPDGTAWAYFPHDHARSRAYRWNEDGLAGISDDQGRLCFALALWNGRDPILKERLFGLGAWEGNHGEDVKEYYHYLDSTPTHSYMKMLYKYPQAAFPYNDLVESNRNRGKDAPEYELFDTGVFAEDRYFDVTVEYAKAGPADILVRLSATNRGPDPAELHLLPTLWFRNTWDWGHPGVPRPIIRADSAVSGAVIRADDPELGRYRLVCAGTPDLLFTENETNRARLYNVTNPTPFVKDGIGEAVVAGRLNAVNAVEVGTKAAAHYEWTLTPGASETVYMRLTAVEASAPPPADPLADAQAVFALRRAEADAFYAAIQPPTLTDDERLVQRQAFAGLLWSKQFYYYDVQTWLAGDAVGPVPSESRRHGRNADWGHLSAAAILSMPDKWEYPWFAAWDLAFHCLPLALIDPDFAKEQLLLLERPEFMRPTGQIPASEWAFGDVSPPVLAWAARQVYEIDARQWGTPDRAFLERVFHKLLIHFTWWAGRRDAAGLDLFTGGIMGLDSVGLIDRGAGPLEGSDSTPWMGVFCAQMLSIARELAGEDPAYDEIAATFAAHLRNMAGAMRNMGNAGLSLWDDADGFFYDVLRVADSAGGGLVPLKVRAFGGLVPLFAARADWGDLTALVDGTRLKAVLRRVLDEAEFLSPFGVRSLSRAYAEYPYILEAGGVREAIAYLPGESNNWLFGGNANWRGPVWFPINYLLIAALREYDRYYGDDFALEFPTASGEYHTLDEIAAALSDRLLAAFAPDATGRRPVFGNAAFAADPHWRDLIPFPEYLHGETGAGLGASHETGWTALVALLLQERGQRVLREHSRPLGVEELDVTVAVVEPLAPVAVNVAHLRQARLFPASVVCEVDPQLQELGPDAELVPCPICATPSDPQALSEAELAAPDVKAHLAAAHPGWDPADGACPACVQQALLQTLLDAGHAAFHEQIQAAWPLDAEAAFGALPTPLRMHADPRYSGRGVTMAWIDSGFYPHPDLVRPRNRIRAWADASRDPVVSHTFAPDETPDWPGWDAGVPSQWHGLMTSTVAAGNGWSSHGLYRGLASSADMVLIQVTDENGHITAASLIRALGWLRQHAAEFGVRVVNMSVSGDPVAVLAGNPVDEAVADLVTDGITVVVAAGNSGERHLIPPATAPAALTIGGIDDRNTFDHLAQELWHSNYGMSGDYLPKPELVAPSLWVVAPVLPGSPTAATAADLFARRAAGDSGAEGALADMHFVTPHYQHVEGTSFAAPLVASVVACMLEANPALTPDLVREILVSTAQPVFGAEPDRQGAGVVDPGPAVARALREHHTTPLGRALSPLLLGEEIHFLFHDHRARQVYVYGSWDEWQDPGVEAVSIEPGLWRAILPRPAAGRYTYKFRLDGARWVPDPANPRRLPDTWGGLNAILDIGDL